jgi:hypothetical protein
MADGVTMTDGWGMREGLEHLSANRSLLSLLQSGTRAHIRRLAQSVEACGESLSPAVGFPCPPPPRKHPPMTKPVLIQIAFGVILLAAGAAIAFLVQGDSWRMLGAVISTIGVIIARRAFRKRGR